MIRKEILLAGGLVGMLMAVAGLAAFVYKRLAGRRGYNRNAR